MKAKQQKPYYVYTLAHPPTVPFANIVFYVGKGQGKRVDAHEMEARGMCQCKKCEVIRHIWGVGGQVQKTIIYETDDESEALAFEQQAISFTYASSHLVNVNHNHLAAMLNATPHTETTPMPDLKEGDMAAFVSGMSVEEINRIFDEIERDDPKEKNPTTASSLGIDDRYPSSRHLRMSNGSFALRRRYDPVKPEPVELYDGQGHLPL